VEAEFTHTHTHTHLILLSVDKVHGGNAGSVEVVSDCLGAL
jgi:hypothetical protein